MKKGRIMQIGNAWALQPLAEMTTGKFNDEQTLLKTCSGMLVSEQRHSFLQAELSACVRALSLSDYGRYSQHVMNQSCAALESVVLLGQLMIQEKIFRHAESLQAAVDF